MQMRFVTVFIFLHTLQLINDLVDYRIFYFLFGLKTDYKLEKYDFWFIKRNLKWISLGTTVSERKELQNESMLNDCSILAQNVNNYIVLKLGFDYVIWVRITQYIVHWFG